MYGRSSEKQLAAVRRVSESFNTRIGRSEIYDILLREISVDV